MPQEDNQTSPYLLPKKQEGRIQPLQSSNDDAAALALIRQKINSLHKEEPAAKVEREVADQTPQAQRSKHQQFMHELSVSGKSLADIQIAWHKYYQDLPEHEKHEVWQEFYQQHGQHSHKPVMATQQQKPAENQPTEAEHHQPSSFSKSIQKNQPLARQFTSERPADIRRRILEKVAGTNKKRQANVKSIAFGLGMGFAVLLIGAFGVFNQRFIAPFITPSTVLSSTPLILDEGAAVGDEPKIIIPKINLDLPVVYDVESIDEATVQRGLEEGILHYPITSQPGEAGNSVFFGHSSNNILNRGDYKFAFVLLNQLEEGDTFMIEKDGVRYVYRVFDKKVVPPTDISVLNSHPEKESIASLITCDPPGTSVNRLVVLGEQISPDPMDNAENSAPDRSDEGSQPDMLPSDAPSLWSRWFGS